MILKDADNTTLAVRVVTIPVPYGCLCENEFNTPIVPVWHPTTNGTCAPSLYSNFGMICYKFPRIENIIINHSFDYGSVVFTSQNATKDSNITATLKLLGNKPAVSEKWLTNTSDWWTYNMTSGTINIDLTPPAGSNIKVLGHSVSCQSAALEFALPMPLEDIDVFSSGSISKQKPFLYCVSSQDNPPPPGQPTGCIDLSVISNDVSISVFSESDVAISDLGKNGSQSQLFTSLLDEIPFGDINIKSGYGNIISESIFAVGGVSLLTNQGYVVMKNSFAKQVNFKATTGDVEGVDIAAFKNIEKILAALTPKSAKNPNPPPLNPKVDFGDITIQSDFGDCITTGIFAYVYNQVVIIISLCCLFLYKYF